MKTTVIYSDRKTVGLEMRRGDEVIVRAPRGIKKEELDRILQSRQAWIEKTREKLLFVEQKSAGRIITYEDMQRLAQQAMEVIPKKVAYWSKIIGVHCSRITIRNQKTKWGSCIDNGHLNFNCLLMLAPEYVQDAVVVHELCHLKEMNHSAAFYALMDSFIPNRKEAENWLKTEGRALIHDAFYAQSEGK